MKNLTSVLTSGTIKLEEDRYSSGDTFSFTTNGVLNLESNEIEPNIEYENLYRYLAEKFNNMMTQRQFALDEIYDCTVTIINIRTSVSFDAISVSTKFSTAFKKLYQNVYINIQTESPFINTVKIINAYTKQAINNDLKSFVNNIWQEGDQVAPQWAYLSEKGGEDVSEWNC